MAKEQAAVDAWDADPDYIGFPEARAALVTLSNTAHPLHDWLDQCPEDHLTKRMAYAPGRTTELWKGFLADLTGGDVMLESALQTWTASALWRGN